MSLIQCASFVRARRARPTSGAVRLVEEALIQQPDPGDGSDQRRHGRGPDRRGGPVARWLHAAAQVTVKVAGIEPAVVAEGGNIDARAVETCRARKPGSPV